MEAPEKIYFDGERSACKLPVFSSRNIEYTRTDAFIEKACEFVANNMRCDGYTLQTKAKFIKEFRNYLKGE